MISITKIDKQYLITCNDEEALTIDKLLSKHNRKLEKHIEDYLASRKINIREQENILIMRHMSDVEREQRLKDIGDGEGIVNA